MLPAAQVRAGGGAIQLQLAAFEVATLRLSNRAGVWERVAESFAQIARISSLLYKIWNEREWHPITGEHNPAPWLLAGGKRPLKALSACSRPTSCFYREKPFGWW